MASWFLGFNQVYFLITHIQINKKLDCASTNQHPYHDIKRKAESSYNEHHQHPQQLNHTKTSDTMKFSGHYHWM